MPSYAPSKPRPRRPATYQFNPDWLVWHANAVTQLKAHRRHVAEGTHAAQWYDKALVILESLRYCKDNSTFAAKAHDVRHHTLVAIGLQDESAARNPRPYRKRTPTSTLPPPKPAEPTHIYPRPNNIPGFRWHLGKPKDTT